MVKSLCFPTYEDWIKMERDFSASLGAYNYSIKPVCWYMYSGKIDYQLAISTDAIPTNAYSHKIYNKYIEIDNLETDKLEAWYNKITREADTFFKDYIVKTYFEEEEQNGV